MERSKVGKVGVANTSEHGSHFILKINADFEVGEQYLVRNELMRRGKGEFLVVIPRFLPLV